MHFTHFLVCLKEFENGSKRYCGQYCIWQYIIYARLLHVLRRGHSRGQGQSGRLSQIIRNFFENLSLKATKFCRQKLLNGALVNLLKFWQQMISRLVLGAATSMLATASDGDKFEEKLPT